DLDQAAADHHAVVGDLDRLVEATVGRVVLEQVGVHRRRGEVVDGHDFDLGSSGPAGPEEDPSNATETIDANPNWPILRHALRLLESSLVPLSDQIREG